MEDVLRAAQNARHGAPGPDGLPYSPWRAIGHIGATVLHDLLRALAMGARVPRSLNAALSAFTPKLGAGGPALQEWASTTGWRHTHPLH